MQRSLDEIKQKFEILISGIESFGAVADWALEFRKAIDDR